MSRFSNLFQEPTPDPETLDGYIEDARDGDNDGIISSIDISDLLKNML